jgi:hypothetical protein
MTKEQLKITKNKFNVHKSGAKSRNISFNFTFDEWLNFWIESGHWEERGNKKGQYVMSRKNDIGPYELGNVYIQLGEQNLKDIVRTEEMNKHHSEMMKGKKMKPELVEQLRIKMMGNSYWKKQIRNDLGQYQKVEV